MPISPGRHDTIELTSEQVRNEAIEVLELWHGWLADGGTLLIEVPDFEEICNNFYKNKYWMTRHTFGSQDAEHNYHKDGWYESKFYEVLPKIGFEIKDIKRRITRGVLPNITVIAEKI